MRVCLLSPKCAPSMTEMVPVGVFLTMRCCTEWCWIVHGHRGAFLYCAGDKLAGSGIKRGGRMDQSFEVGHGMLFSLSFKTGGADANWLGADQLPLGFVLRAGCRRVMMIT